MIQLNSIFIIVGWITLVLITAIKCRQYFPAYKELSRKIVHIGTGPVIALAWWLEIPASSAVLVSLFITIGLFSNYKMNFLKAIEDIERKSFGTIAYGASITLLLALFWKENQAGVTAGVLSMALGDGAAGLIGSQVKSPKWKIFGQTKSIAGTATMAIVVAISLCLISSFSDLNVQALQIIYVTILAVGLEQISPWGIDNLTVPIGVAITWILLIKS